VSGVPVELRYFTVWSFRGNKLIRIENFRERGEALEAAGLSEYRPPSVGGLETRWKQRIAATRGGSQPLRPRIGRFLGVRQQTAEHGSPLGTFHTREVAGSKPAAPIIP
jgi:hypothetical protein